MKYLCDINSASDFWVWYSGGGIVHLLHLADCLAGRRRGLKQPWWKDIMTEGARMKVYRDSHGQRQEKEDEGEKESEMSSKLVWKISHPDLIWTPSLWAHQAQPISYNITNTGLLACVDVCVCVWLSLGAGPARCLLGWLSALQTDGESGKLEQSSASQRNLHKIK